MPPLNRLSEKKNGTTAVKDTCRKPRVIHVGKFYPPHMGGIETHLQALCNELKASVDLRVIVSNDDRMRVHDTPEGVDVTRVPTLMKFASTPICPGMVSLLRNTPGDIVHLHVPNPMAVLAYLASGHRGKLVVTYHSDMVRQKILGPMFEPFLHAVLRRSSAIIATSVNYLKTSPVLVRHEKQCHVIPLGIPIQDFAHCDPKAAVAVREQYGDRLIVSVGRLVYYKGFEFLIRAMERVRGTLLIVGEGPLREALGTLARQLGVADRVHFLGKVDHHQLLSCYHAANVFTMASVARSEAFGIAQIEAMAAGLPVVNTQLDSGVPFVSQHGKTGFTVPPCDPAALAVAISRLLDSPELQKTFGTAARLRASQEFSLDVMASRTKTLYEQVLSSGALALK